MGLFSVVPLLASLVSVGAAGVAQADPGGAECAPLEVAGFGDPGQAVAKATLEPDGSACFTFTAEAAGLYLVPKDGHADPAVSGPDGSAVDCSGDSYTTNGMCALPSAGAYTLTLTNRAWGTNETTASVVPLGGTRGCAAPVSSRWDQPEPGTTTASPLEVDCQPFDAAPGERIRLTSGSRYYGDSLAWITDETGARVCPQFPEDDETSCVLPGDGPYRVLSRVSSAERGFPAEYAVKARRLNDPQGCAPVPVRPFGPLTALESDAVPCRTFTADRAGPYTLRSVDQDGDVGHVTVYDAAGKTVCTAYGDVCEVPRAGTYTAVLDGTYPYYSDREALIALDRASGAGCVAAPMGLFRGELASPGQYDCLTLDAPEGASVAALTPLGPSKKLRAGVEVVDSAGAVQCDDSELADEACVLTGAAPYRALARVGDYSEQQTGAYGVALHRTGDPEGCRVLPAGSFAADGAEAAFTLGDGVFSECLSIPADSRARVEILQLTGDLPARFSVVDAAGKRVCGQYSSTNSWSICPLTPGLAHTVLVTGRDERAGYTVARRDISDGAVPAGCTSAPASEVGGPSVARASGGPGTLTCHQVTTDAPTDVVHVRARDALGTADTVVLGAGGAVECSSGAVSCAVTGATTHTVLARVPAGAKAAPEYHLDALRVATADGPSPACARVPSVAYGYGPITGTLDERHTAVCAVLPTGRLDILQVETGADTVAPALYDRDTRNDGCTRYIPSGWQCAATSSSTSATAPTVLLLGLPGQSSGTSFSVRLTCKYTPCGPDRVSVTGLSPTSAAGDGKATLTVTGTALGPDAVVRLHRSGKTVSAPVSWIAPDNRSATADVDLTGVEPGVWSVSVVTRGVQYSRGSFTVTQPLLTSTAAPVITGTPKVGATLTAGTGSWSGAPTSYTYRWTADGSPVSGATGASYVVPAELLGKRLGVTVTAARSGWGGGTAESATVVVGVGDALRATKAPAIVGAVKVGGVVKAGTGVWSPAAATYRYQWTADGKAISGATGASYGVPAALRGKKLGLVVTAVRAGWANGAASSAAVTVALGDAPRATKAPAISGTAKVGRTLKAGTGTWSPAATSYAYQWYAGGKAISGATKASLVLKTAQKGQKITVKVTARRAGHKDGAAVSAATKAVVK
ncbi:Tat pathway signal protein [Streptomyces sp. NPDC004539]|uniref:Tat pathway signal protein n=1 Tax=Streptomyces sp. NPDC004539 TaxID=3154280 RepID=UPI0033B410FC